ncbi:hypothetical protein J6590_024602 [Homalodisca vitripennis]|nr:hypothetical protein J6590_024602 [Homalodisca vitripennis]
MMLLTCTAERSFSTKKLLFSEQNGALLSVHYGKISVVWTLSPKLFLATFLKHEEYLIDVEMVTKVQLVYVATWAHHGAVCRQGKVLSLVKWPISVCQAEPSTVETAAVPPRRTAPLSSCRQFTFLLGKLRDPSRGLG